MKCCQYNAGMLREPVLIERKIRVSNLRGGFTEIWDALASVRGAVVPMSGREMMMQDRVNATEMVQVVIRYQVFQGGVTLDGGGPGDDGDDVTADGGAPDDEADGTVYDGGDAWEHPPGLPIAEDRLTIRGKRYNVRYVRIVEFANRWLEITAEGGVAV